MWEHQNIPHARAHSSGNGLNAIRTWHAFAKATWNIPEQLSTKGRRKGDQGWQIITSRREINGSRRESRDVRSAKEELQAKGFPAGKGADKNSKHSISIFMYMNRHPHTWNCIYSIAHFPMPTNDFLVEWNSFFFLVSLKLSVRHFNFQCKQFEVMFTIPMEPPVTLYMLHMEES